MRWESVHVNARARETPEGRKTSGRTGGIWGPGVRWGHTCNVVRGGRHIYVFGGYGADNSQTNDVHVFDTVKQTWCKPMMKGIPPSPRDSHSCTTVGTKLFVFGGTDGKTPLRDLHILDTSSNTWIIPTLQGEGPDAREGHSSALIGRRLFIFGGCGKSSENQEVYYNDLYILDTEKLVWERAVTSGTPPSARDSHTSSSWKNRLVILGGEDSSDCYLSDVHMLDADTLAWKQVSTSGQMIAPRAGHTTVALGNKLFVFGGFTDDRNLYDDLHILDIDTGLWNKAVTSNEGLSARFSAAGDCLDERRGILVFIGGCNKDLEALDDMYYLHTDIHAGNGLFGERQEKSSLRKELKQCQEKHISSRISENRVDALNIGMTSNPSQPLINQECDQSGAKISDTSSPEALKFVARITESNDYGFSIETIIGGHFLRGVVFSCTAGLGKDSHAYPNKKRMVIDTGGDNLMRHQKTDTLIQQPGDIRGKGPAVDLGAGLTISIPDVGLNMTSRNLEPSSSAAKRVRIPDGSSKPSVGNPSEFPFPPAAVNLGPSSVKSAETPDGSPKPCVGKPSERADPRALRNLNESPSVNSDEVPDDSLKPSAGKPCESPLTPTKDNRLFPSKQVPNIEEHHCPNN